MTQTSSESIVEAIGVTKVFRDFWQRPKVPAVQDVTFSVKRGEIFGLLGPNGSGKSTTLKMILGLLHPSRGTLRVMSQSPRAVKIKARIGYLPEESYLYPYLTCEETLHFYGKLFDLNVRERRQRIEQLLEMIGLKHARKRQVGEFSKGMARRIGLAQALINDPDLIILDEPTSGLDPLGCRQVKDLILALAQRGKTVLLSSHLLADVEDVCDRVAILYNGRVRAMGTIQELLKDPHSLKIGIPAKTEGETIQYILNVVRDAIGQEPVLEYPHRDLETFFLEVIEKARQGSAESSGVGASAGLADFLVSELPQTSDDVLRSYTPDVIEKPREASSESSISVEDLREVDKKLKELMSPPEQDADDKPE